MASYDLEKFALRNYNVKRERSQSPFLSLSPQQPQGRIQDQAYETVTLSAVCKETGPYNPGQKTEPIFSWQHNPFEMSHYDFSWNRPRHPGVTSPLSSVADCSLTEDGSNTLSPHIAAAFEPTDYTNPNSFPGSPQETWVQVNDMGYDAHNYQTLPFNNGSSAPLIQMAQYPKSQLGMHLPQTLPSQHVSVPLYQEQAGFRSRKRKSSGMLVKPDFDDQDYQEEEDAGSDYAPQQKKKTRARYVRPTKANVKRIIRHGTPGGTQPQHQHDPDVSCHLCAPQPVDSKIRHVAASHNRLFACTFRIYGCKSSFGSKNEWKRHVATKHLQTAFWRCDRGRCAPTKVGDTPKDFNRKDLFMQHIRRMHMPTEVRDKEELDATIDSIARDCYYQVRDPPSKSICGFCYAKGKREDFYGVASWEHRMEHVGKHLEEPGSDKLDCVRDQLLEDWLLKEELIVADGEGEYILTSLLS